MIKTKIKLHNQNVLLATNLTIKRLGFGSKGQSTMQNERQIFPGNTTTTQNDFAYILRKQNYLYEKNQKEKEKSEFVSWHMSVVPSPTCTEVLVVYSY